VANVSRTPTESVSTGTKRTMEPAAALELIDSGKTIPKELAAKILSSVRPVTPRQAEEIAKGFEEKTGIPAQEAKRHLKIVSREWITPSIRFKPVWTLHNDVSYCAIQIQEASQEGGVAQPEQPTMLIVTSEGKTLYREDLGLLGLQVDDNWDEETVGWSPPSVKKFLDGAEPLLPADLFRQISENIHCFCDLPSIGDLPKEYTEKFLALWVMHSFFMPIFSATGYLFLTSVENRYGKSRVAGVIGRMAFDAQVISGASTFAAIRDGAHWEQTQIIDDVTNLKELPPGALSMFLCGYKRDGASTRLKQADQRKGWVGKNVDAFCPRVFTTTEGAPLALLTRMYTIPMHKTKDKALSKRDPNYTAPPHAFQELRDGLYHLAFCSMPKVRSLYEGDIEALMDRPHERWRPLLALALWIDPEGTLYRETKGSLYDEMVELAECWELEAEREQAESGPKAPILRALVTLVSEGKETVSAGEVADRIPGGEISARKVGGFLVGAEYAQRLAAVKHGYPQFRLNREYIMEEAVRLELDAPEPPLPVLLPDFAARSSRN